jgi:hypothetical protein
MNDENDNAQADVPGGITLLPAPADGARVETGVVQFGDDWPGVFIRGDNAAYYAMALETELNYPGTDPMALLAVKELFKLLTSSRV